MRITCNVVYKNTRTLFVYIVTAFLVMFISRESIASDDQAATPAGFAWIVELKASQGEASAIPEADSIALLQSQFIADIFPNRVLDASVVYRYKNLPMLAINADSVVLSAAMRHWLVKRIYPVNKVYLQKIYDPTISSIDFSSLNVIGLGLSQRTNWTGMGWRVAVLDTGVDADHIYLKGKVTDEICFSDCRGATGVAGHGSSFPKDNDNHGTHVAGIIAGGSNVTESTYHVAPGIVPKAKIISVRVLSDSGSTHSVLAGLDYVMGLVVNGAKDIAAVNMSLGELRTQYAGICETPYDSAFQFLTERGIAVVVAAGNDGYRRGISTPACALNAISVMATNVRGQLASFSNFGSNAVLAAPGHVILS